MFVNTNNRFVPRKLSVGFNFNFWFLTKLSEIPWSSLHFQGLIKLTLGFIAWNCPR